MVMKELMDNGLDATEENGIAPRIDVTIDKAITVADNGPGIPRSTLLGVADYSRRISTNSKYVAPTRGAQGNALKTIIAVPQVLDGSKGTFRFHLRDSATKSASTPMKSGRNR